MLSEANTGNPIDPWAILDETKKTRRLLDFKCKFCDLKPISPWQTETIVYRRCVTGSPEWPVEFWKFWSSSLPHQRGRALAL